MTWKGWIIEDSLKDASVLSRLKIVKSITEKNEEADEVKIWRLYTVEAADSKIDEIVKAIEKSIKLEWYAHFTDRRNLIIIFSGKHFRIKLEKILKETETGAVEFKADPKELDTWKNAFEYGTKDAKVDPRYIIKVV